MANWLFYGRDATSYLVGKMMPYKPASGSRHAESDLAVLTSVVDGNRNPVPDLVTARRHVYPLPGGQAAVHYMDQIAQYANPGPDLATLGPFVYGRIVEEFVGGSYGSLTAGFIVEVTDIPSASYPGKPSVGDKVVAYKPHLYRETEDRVFVRIARALNSHHDYGFFLRAVEV